MPFVTYTPDWVSMLSESGKEKYIQYILRARYAVQQHLAGNTAGAWEATTLLAHALGEMNGPYFMCQQRKLGQGWMVGFEWQGIHYRIHTLRHQRACVLYVLEKNDSYPAYQGNAGDTIYVEKGQ